MRIFFILFGCSFFSLATFAQNETYRHTFTGNLGFSTVGTFIDVFDNNNLNDFELEIEDYGEFSGFFTGRSLPAFQVNYDYGIKNWLSVGGGVSYQNLNFNIANLSYNDDNGNRENVSELSVTTNRINISGRVLFHYGNKGKLDLYSGIRLGVTNWLTNLSATNQTVEDDLEANIPYFGILPAAQIIPFGLRAYFGENWGANFETGLGSPHFLALGVNYRL